MTFSKKERDQRFWNKNKVRLLAKRKEARIANPAYMMFHKAKNRAKKNGIQFTISIEDTIIPMHCPILGIKLEASNGYRSEATPSLDQIIPGKGYIKKNIAVISWRANRIKNDGLLSEFEKIVEYLRQV